MRNTSPKWPIRSKSPRTSIYREKQVRPKVIKEFEEMMADPSKWTVRVEPGMGGDIVCALNNYPPQIGIGGLQ